MALQEAVEEALREAGNAVKKDLWKPQDAAFLRARAKDLIGLNKKADAAQRPEDRAAYVAAARDVVHHVTLLATIRLEGAAHTLLDTLGKVFIDKVVPALLKLLPALLGL